MKLTSKILASFAGSALLAAGLGACASSDAQSGKEGAASEEVTVGLTYIPNVQFAPVYLADFENVAAPVSVRHHGTDEGLFSALMSGEEQVTVATGDELLQARAQGMELIAVSAYYHKYPVEIVVPEDSDITTLGDLRGKRIGIPGEFGSSWFGLLAALQVAGLTTEDVDVVTVGFTQSASLVAGEVDAIVAFVNSEPAALEEMGFASRSLSLDLPEVPLVGATVVTTSEWASANETELREVLAAITRGTEKAIQDPDAALTATEEWDESLGDPTSRSGAESVLLATIPLWEDSTGHASGLQDLEQWDRMAPFLANLLEEPELEQAGDGAATNEYVE